MKRSAIAAIAMFPRGTAPIKPGRRALWIAALFAAALMLRVVAIETKQLHVDESGTADYTLRHILPPVPETLSPFRTGAMSQPALYYYLTRLSLQLAGESIAGLRASSAIAGSLGVITTVGMVAVLHRWRVAWLAGIYVAVSHFAIHWSRLALNNIWDTVWVPLILGLYAWAWKTRWTGAAVLAGLALGFSQYFYPGSKLGILLLGFLIARLRRSSS